MSEFQRKKIRPWDDIETLMPISNQKGINKESYSNPKGNQIVTNTSEHNKPFKNQLVTNETFGKTDKEPISNPISNHNRGTNSNQLVNQLVTNNEAKDSVKRLWGLQRIILFYIVQQCVSDGHLISGPITNEKLREITGTDADTIKTAVQRLKNKKLILGIEGKRGKGGFASYSINKDIRGAVLDEMKHLNIGNQLVTKQVTADSNHIVTNKIPNKESEISSSSSSDLINNKNTTTTALPSDWEEIDLSELHKRNIRFGINHLKDLYPVLKLKNYTGYDIQESIDSFVYDLDHNYVQARRGPLNLLIGTLRNGTLYYSSHYVSPEQQQINEMIKLADKKKREREEYNLQLENEAFYKWLEEYGDEKLMKKLPVDMMVLFNARAKEAMEWIKTNIYKKELHGNK